jgi:hypothetical protein
MVKFSKDHSRLKWLVLGLGLVPTLWTMVNARESFFAASVYIVFVVLLIVFYSVKVF